MNFQHSGNDKFYDLQTPVLMLISAIASQFILFNSGQEFHTNSARFGDIIYKTEWYRYPRSLQRFVQLVIMRYQRPYYLSVFGVMAFHLENFVRVNGNQCDFTNLIEECIDHGHKFYYSYSNGCTLHICYCVAWVEGKWGRQVEKTDESTNLISIYY